MEKEKLRQEKKKQLKDELKAAKKAANDAAKEADKEAKKAEKEAKKSGKGKEGDHVEAGKNATDENASEDTLRKEGKYLFEFKITEQHLIIALLGFCIFMVLCVIMMWFHLGWPWRIRAERRGGRATQPLLTTIVRK